MSVAVCRSSMLVPPSNIWQASPQHDEQHKSTDLQLKSAQVAVPAGQFDIWSMIQSQKKTMTSVDAAGEDRQYVHPLARRSSSGLMSQKSLKMCTESLGSESGSDDFFAAFSPDDEEFAGYSSSSSSSITVMTMEEELEEEEGDLHLHPEKQPSLVVSNHSISRRSPPRSFPPPLTSISSPGGPRFQMRHHRRDGRLVMEAVPVPSQNYLQAHRLDGRLLLSFIDTTPFHHQDGDQKEDVSLIDEYEQAAEEDEEEEEEQVEVVDRGTVVEVKVSTQPQQQSGAAVHRSSLFINKFVGLNEQKEPHTNNKEEEKEKAVSASSPTESVGHRRPPHPESKLLFTSKRRNREELLHHMRRCSQLHRPLFIREPCCIATSSS